MSALIRRVPAGLVTTRVPVVALCASTSAAMATHTRTLFTSTLVVRAADAPVGTPSASPITGAAIPPQAQNQAASTAPCSAQAARSAAGPADASAARSTNSSTDSALDVAMRVNKLKRAHQQSSGDKKSLEGEAWIALNSLTEEQINAAEGKAVALLLNSWAYFAKFWEKGRDGP